MPFGGVKGSGHGRFGGKAAIAEFTDLRWITIEDPQHRSERAAHSTGNTRQGGFVRFEELLQRHGFAPRQRFDRIAHHVGIAGPHIDID